MQDLGPKLSILVIDDNPDALEILQGLLEQNGYRALVASSGAEGIALARAEKPDLVLLDIMMPEMSGFQVCQALKSDPACEDIPVVILTARKAERDWSYARTVGAADFLTKPVRPSQLLGTLKRHLSGRVRVQAAQQLGIRHILAIATDSAFLRMLSGSFDAHNYVRKSKHRYGLLSADGFAEARSILREHHPAAVIVDAQARNEGADQVVRLLKTDASHKALPLLVVRHEKGDDLKFAWADARLPGRPSGKEVVAAVVSLIEH